MIFDIKRDCSDDGPGIRTTVFFKGCPLSCVWCHNPEGVKASPGISFDSNVCNPADCGCPCLKQCCNGTLTVDTSLQVDYSLCSRCDNCFEVCPTNALEPVGRWLTEDDLFYEVCVDKTFYDSTGGGVTLSGGEPTMQMEFINCFLQRLKDEGINTAIETCGFFDFSLFQEKALPFLDLIFFDLKLIDDTENKKHTGQSNKIILENFCKLVQNTNVKVIPRIPLIPGITTTSANLTGIGKFLKDLNISNCELMPYNPLWYDKLNKLGAKADYQNRSFLDHDEKNRYVEYLFQLA